jgi:hypothetical protein
MPREISVVHTGLETDLATAPTHRAAWAPSRLWRARGVLSDELALVHSAPARVCAARPWGHGSAVQNGWAAVDGCVNIAFGAAVQRRTGKTRCCVWDQMMGRAWQNRRKVRSIHALQKCESNLACEPVPDPGTP